MPLAKLITPKKINILGAFRFSFSVLLIAFFFPAFSQDNSPYSRYGLGDLVSPSNITSRAMGGISAAYVNPYSNTTSVNYSNPATYGSFFTIPEPNSKKILFGRSIFDVGVNIENRTLKEPSQSAEKFTASNFLVSHLKVGIPLRRNWGMSFGLRPISRISYSIVQNERLHDPNTGQNIDSAQTLYTGDGGAYLATLGTGFKIKNFSLGFDGGYMFGKKVYNARRSIFNDSLNYASGNFETKTSFGDIFFNFGALYKMQLDTTVFLTLGAFGNLKHHMNATQDLTRETYIYNPNTGNIPIDSVYKVKDMKGTIDYPSTFTAGFTIAKYPKHQRDGSWLIGVDYYQGKWEDYRFYGQVDSLRNKWELRVGGEIRPAPKKNYFSNVVYRFGAFLGPDYIKVQQKLPLLGLSFGMGLPVGNFNRLNNQVSIINLAIEYIKRGTDDNLLKENMFRLSVGFAFSDFWFAKRKYE